MFKFLFCFLVSCTLVFTAYAQQSREELQKQEQDLKKELAELNQLLSQTQKNKKLSLSQLALIKRKVAMREQLVNSINRQIRDLDNTIFLNERDIYRLRRELDTLRVKYAKSIVFAYKNRSSYEYLNFIFSSKSFNDAIKRITYLKSYRQNRETQADAIIQSEKLLTTKIEVLSSNKKERLTTLEKQSEQLKVLQDDKKAQDQVVAQLKGKEKELSVQIQNKEKQRQKMQQAVMAIIRREADEAAKRAKLKAAEDAKKAAANNTKPVDANAGKTNAAGNTTKNPSVNEPLVSKPVADRPYTPLESTPEGRETSIQFEQNKGRLPWPVDKGNVYVPFGISTVPGTKITQKSDGIQIALPEGSAVKSVADGEVVYASEVNGDQVVLVRHGKYFTSYNQLSSISVSLGQQVKAGSVIGRSGKSIDGEGAIIFVINNEKGVPMNPELWLKPRR
ncbi:murein hydrolase activator EnvC family protein [Sediminibacterium goheungense]|uniref:Septal ring factor EnvC (AmiA/AmiB activator) n=1 Tax=Sediminibacterium goheungense TaxID=1086393 RepID=A0A4R6IX25_9BACT|nr:peptidoglycan DD-metalloendopeptidase family protein [Sediminibacterium goheungense]TDO26947.1 septal ring factor EnvC (AmiA/AmiB activator) [Sediminibacterium goheungense]